MNDELKKWLPWIVAGVLALIFVVVLVANIGGGDTVATNSTTTTVPDTTSTGPAPETTTSTVPDTTSTSPAPETTTSTVPTETTSTLPSGTTTAGAELSVELNQELMENPFLEEGVEDEGSGPDTQNDPPAAENPESPLEKIFEFGADDYFADRASDGRDLGYFGPGGDAPPSFEQFLGTTTDLTDHLIWQLRFSAIPREIAVLCEAVIGNVNEDGYLDVSTEELVRFCATGRLTPDLWMQTAVGKEFSADPLLKATRKALGVITE